MNRPTGTKLIAVAGGKGGVGKTICAANLALDVASRNTALAVDLDIGCGNLNACLGVRVPDRNINQFLDDESATLDDFRLPTPVRSLGLVSGSYNSTRLYSLDTSKKSRLLRTLRNVEADYTFLDLGAGITGDILDFFSFADMKILVTTPEALAMHNAFLFVKSLVFRILGSELEKDFFTPAVQKELASLFLAPDSPGIPEALERLHSWSRHYAYVLEGILREVRIHVILNMTRNGRDHHYTDNFHNLARKYLNLDLTMLGFVPYDRRVRTCVNRIVPLMLEYRRSSAAKAFREIAGRIEQVFGTAAP